MDETDLNILLIHHQFIPQSRFKMKNYPPSVSPSKGIKLIHSQSTYPEVKFCFHLRRGIKGEETHS
jgi:hypothetical protein